MEATTHERIFKRTYRAFRAYRGLEIKQDEL